MAQTLYDKLWNSHVVHVDADGTALLYIDRHLVHEVTSPQAYEGLKLAGRQPWRIGSGRATASPNPPPTGLGEGLSRNTARDSGRAGTPRATATSGSTLRNISGRAMTTTAADVASAAALAGVSSGAWYADVAQAPASEGRLAVSTMIKALRQGKSSGGIDPVAGLPNNGVVTKANASQFTAEWPG